MSLGSSAGTSIFLGVAFELSAHIFVHYTIPGAQFASILAQNIAPVLDGIGLETVFADAAGNTVAANLDSLMSLDAIGIG